jgi:putative heme transporter
VKELGDGSARVAALRPGTTALIEGPYGKLTGETYAAGRASGASGPIAVAVMLLSGVASVAGLALLYAGDVLAWTSLSYRTLAVVAAVAAAIAWVVHRARAVPANRAPATPPTATGQEPVVEPTVWGRLRGTLHETITLARAVPSRQWARVVAVAAVNWLTDLACLLAALQAVGLTVPARAVATAYLVIQLIRQIPVTPGGIGVIEASLIVALTTAGAAQAPAAAAVLVYRLLSCWTVLPIGLICWTAQRTTSPLTASR